MYHWLNTKSALPPYHWSNTTGGFGLYMWKWCACYLHIITPNHRSFSLLVLSCIQDDLISLGQQVCSCLDVKSILNDYLWLDLSGLLCMQIIKWLMLSSQLSAEQQNVTMFVEVFSDWTMFDSSESHLLCWFYLGQHRLTSPFSAAALTREDLRKSRVSGVDSAHSQVH